MKIFITTSFLFLLSLVAWSNDTTIVELNLNECSNDKLKITIFAPNITADVIEFIIPQIIPGTYMKINYERFYNKFKAYDKDGKTLKMMRRDNHIIIKNATET